MKKKKPKNRKKRELQVMRDIIAEKHHGLQPKNYGNRKFMEGSFNVESHEEHLLQISALLEVCILALDGNAEFHTAMLRHKTAKDSVQMVLQMIIELLPFDDIFKYERIKAILENDIEHRYFPETLK